MAYFLNLFSPETYEAFSQSNRAVSGFRIKQQKAASKIKIGDKLVCYMTGLSRWIGILEIQSDCFIEDSPIFYQEDDPFVVRFNVKPIVWLPKEKCLPIKDDRIWNELSFTKNYEKATSYWTGKFRNSLNPVDNTDGQFLESILLMQQSSSEEFFINENEYEKYLTHKVKTNKKTISVLVPQDNNQKEDIIENQSEARESIKMQALLASIGSQMGMKIWIPRNDKVGVISEWHDQNKPTLETLPLNYDEATLRTIEQIDILWLKGRSIIRAFEVEHTTSIYSGILRMADLLALQPNMDIKLHIVAPDSRKEKVFQELRRPVFSLLERGPLSESCTYLSYSSIVELSKEKHLSHLSDSVLDDYSESPN